MDEELKQTYPFHNPPLPYSYDALEPFIDAKTMELHHDRHLQTYVDNLNAIITNHPNLQSWTLEKLVFYASSLPASLATSIANNAGGVYNHIFYFNQLTNDKNRHLQEPNAETKVLEIPFMKNENRIPEPYAETRTFKPMSFIVDENSAPLPELNGLINKSFGDFEQFKARLKAQALSVFGSGYAWLTIGSDCRLRISSTANQATPLAEGLCPIINLDVWEHAYYLKHYNVRAAYIDDFFNVINWKVAEERLTICMKQNGCDRNETVH